MIRNFTLDCGGRNVGTVYLPDKYEGKLPVIIHAHGWGGGRDLGAVLKSLLTADVALVSFEFSRVL